MGYDFELDDQASQVHPIYDLEAIGLAVDGIEVGAQLSPGHAPGEYLLSINGQEESVFIATQGDTHFVHLRGRVHRVEAVNALERARRAAGPSGGDEILRAPMPGTVVEVAVAPGDAVSAGQLLLTIESMKLQTAITALQETMVAEVFVAAGDTFDQGAALVRLESEPEANAETDANTDAKTDSNTDQNASADSKATATQQADKKEGQSR